MYSGAFENREYLLVVYEAEKYNAILQTQKKKERTNSLRFNTQAHSSKPAVSRDESKDVTQATMLPGALEHFARLVIIIIIINNNLFIYSALFDMPGDQKRITTINNLKAINTNFQKYTNIFNI